MLILPILPILPPALVLVQQVPTQPETWALDGARYTVKRCENTVLLFNARGHTIIEITLSPTCKVTLNRFAKPAPDPYPDAPASPGVVDGDLYFAKVVRDETGCVQAIGVYNHAGHPILTVVAINPPSTPSPDKDDTVDI